MFPQVYGDGSGGKDFTRTIQQPCNCFIFGAYSRQLIKSQIKESRFEPRAHSTISAAITTTTIPFHGDQVVLNLHDIAISPEYHDMAVLSLKKAHICVLVFSLVNQQSFESLGTISDEISQFKDDYRVFLVGIDSHTPESRVISSESGRARAEALGAQYREVSTHTGVGLPELFYAIAEAFCQSIRLTHHLRLPVNLPPPIAGQNDSTPGILTGPATFSNSDVEHCAFKVFTLVHGDHRYKLNAMQAAQRSDVVYHLWYHERLRECTVPSSTADNLVKCLAKSLSCDEVSLAEGLMEMGREWKSAPLIMSQIHDFESSVLAIMMLDSMQKNRTRALQQSEQYLLQMKTQSVNFDNLPFDIVIEIFSRVQTELQRSQKIKLYICGYKTYSGLAEQFIEGIDLDLIDHDDLILMSQNEGFHAQRARLLIQRDQMTSRTLNSLNIVHENVEYEMTRVHDRPPLPPPGIIHQLQTNVWVRELQSRHQIRITASSTLIGNPTTLVIPGNQSLWCSHDSPNQWIMVEFANLFPLKSYTIVTSVLEYGHMLEWIVEGSTDARIWKRLDHRNCTTLNRPNASGSFEIDSAPLKFFKITQTSCCSGKSQQNNNIMTLCQLHFD